MLSKEFIIEYAEQPKTFQAPNSYADPRGKDWPIGEKQIGNVNVTIMNHFFVRCNNRGIQRADPGHKVEIRKGFAVLEKMCRQGKLLRNIQVGNKFWVWDEATHHSIGGIKQMDRDGVMQFTLKTILAKQPWESDIPVYTV